MISFIIAYYIIRIICTRYIRRNVMYYGILKRVLYL